MEAPLKKELKKINTDFLCIINVDGSMDPKYLTSMLEKCRNEDFIFASRYLKEGGSDDDDIITFVGNKFFTYLGNILYNLNLSDILYTYIIGKTIEAKKLNLNYHDFRICVEIPYKIKKKMMKYDSFLVWKDLELQEKKK